MMTQSALIGSIPATDHDYWIIKGMYRAAFQFTADPSKGYTLMPSRPQGYHYNDKQAGILVGMVVSLLVMVFFTTTRLLLRFFKPGLRSGADDWALMPGAILAIVYPVLQMLMVTHGGAGKHVWDVTYREYNTFNALGVYCKILFFTTVGIIKISIALFLRRMSGLTSKGWRIANDVFLFLLAGYTLLALFWTCFQCSPPPAMWDKVYSGMLAEPATCWSTETIGTALSVIHVVMDFLLLATPILILWRIQLSKAKRVRLYLVFSVGMLSCVASVLRERAQHNINMDITYGFTTLLAWTVVDLTLAVVVASLPLLSALLPSMFRQLTGTSRVYGLTENAGDTNTATATISRAVVSKHRNSPTPSDEDEILRKDDFELSSTQYKSRDRSIDGSETTKDSAVKDTAIYD